MGGRPCTICNHPHRTAIEAAIVAGTSFRVISSQFSVGDGSVQRHATSHIAEAVRATQTAREVILGLDIAQQLQVINSVTLNILQETRSAFQEFQREKEDQLTVLDQVKVFKDLQTLTLQAVDRVSKQLDLQLRLQLLPGGNDEMPEYVVGWIGGSLQEVD